MNSDKEKSMKKGDYSNSSSHSKPQQTKESDQKKSEYKAGANQTVDRSKNDTSSERRSEKQVSDPKEFAKKDNKNYSAKSGRV